MPLNAVDELIISASGLEAAVEGLRSTKTFGASTTAQKSSPLPEESDIQDIFAQIDVDEYNSNSI